MKKHWEVKKLGDIAVVQSGGTPLRSNKEYWHGGYRDAAFNQAIAGIKPNCELNLIFVYML